MGDHLEIFDEIDKQIKKGDYVPLPGDGLASAAQAAGVEIKVVELPGHESRLSRAVVNVLPALDPAVIKLREEVHK